MRNGYVVLAVVLCLGQIAFATGENGTLTCGTSGNATLLINTTGDYLVNVDNYFNSQCSNVTVTANDVNVTPTCQNSGNGCVFGYVLIYGTNFFATGNNVHVVSLNSVSTDGRQNDIYVRPTSGSTITGAKTPLIIGGNANSVVSPMDTGGGYPSAATLTASSGITCTSCGSVLMYNSSNIDVNMNGVATSQSSLVNNSNNVTVHNGAIDGITVVDSVGFILQNMSGTGAGAFTNDTDTTIANDTVMTSLTVTGGSNFMSRPDISTLTVQGLNLGAFQNPSIATFNESSAINIQMVDNTSSSVSFGIANSSGFSIVGNRSLGTLTLTNVTSVYVNALSCLNNSQCGMLINSISLTNSSGVVVDNLKFPTSVTLTGSDNNVFTGSGVYNTSVTSNAGLVFNNSNGNTVQQMYLGKPCSGSQRNAQSITIIGGSHSNIIQNNYFKDACTTSADYAVEMDTGTLGNQITGNIFDMVYATTPIIADLNPINPNVDYNFVNANGYYETINGAKNITGFIVAMTSPLALFYGHDGSDYPYTNVTSGGTLLNVVDAAPLTNISSANATTLNLTVSLISPTFGEVQNNLTFTTIYNISGGTNTRNCYLAAKPSTFNYYPYQQTIDCNGTNNATTVQTYGEYNLVVGAYDDTGGLVATTTFMLSNGSGQAPPSGGGGGPPVTVTTPPPSVDLCIPFLTCAAEPNPLPECTSGVDCPWDTFCKANPTSDGCKIVTNPFLKGTLPWIANLSTSLRGFVFNALQMLQKGWWLLTAILIGYSAKDVLKGKETLSGVISFAAGVTIALIFI